MLRNVYEKNSYNWLIDLAEKVKSNISNRDVDITPEMKAVLFPFVLPKNIAPVPKISKEQLEQRATSRFHQQ
jgi:hypothetical protein